MPGDRVGSATVGGGVVNTVVPLSPVSTQSAVPNLPVTGPSDIIKVGGIGAIVLFIGAALLLAL